MRPTRTATSCGSSIGSRVRAQGSTRFYDGRHVLIDADWADLADITFVFIGVKSARSAKIGKHLPT
jgi:hypothetical protein